MNWDALGAIGEIVGAVGVIVSLLYLAIQVRSSSRQARHAAAQAVLAKLNTLIGQLAFTAMGGFFTNLLSCVDAGSEFMFDFVAEETPIGAEESATATTTSDSSGPGRARI